MSDMSMFCCLRKTWMIRHNWKRPQITSVKKHCTSTFHNGTKYSERSTMSQRFSEYKNSKIWKNYRPAKANKSGSIQWNLRLINVTFPNDKSIYFTKMVKLLWHSSNLGFLRLIKWEKASWYYHQRNQGFGDKIIWLRFPLISSQVADCIDYTFRPL